MHNFLVFIWALLTPSDASNASSLMRPYDASFEISSLIHKLDDLGYKGANTFLAPSESPVSWTQSNATEDCTATCTILGVILPDDIYHQGDPSYNTQQETYWSAQQGETRPVCRIQPGSAKDVSSALLVTKFFHCPFAIKSGGHAPFTNASNIHGGLTIDLLRLNQIQVSNDRTLTQVGSGNRWGDVYSELEPLGLMVTGGRVANIGVGGFILGGGISFFSGSRGWACDNVRNYEVVLANTSIVSANLTSHPDLYFALRGGGSNFGIIIRFDLETFSQGPFWGGMRGYPSSAKTSLLNAFHNFVTANPSDSDTALILAFVYYNGELLPSADIEYAKPIANPSVFDEILGIEHTASTIGITNMSTVAEALVKVNPSGFREVFATATFKPSLDLLEAVLDIYAREVQGLKDAEGFMPALIFQPISKDVIQQFGKHGGNPFGIAVEDGPLVLLNLAIRYSFPNDDIRISATANRIINNVAAKARRLDRHHRFVYQNYAHVSQDVYAGYGANNQQRLIDVSKKYDPEGVFRRLQPGGFKLDGRVQGWG